MPYEELGMDWTEKIERLLEEKDWSARQLELRAGITENTLRSSLDNKRDIQISTAKKLCDALGVKLDWLFDDNQSYPPRRYAITPAHPNDLQFRMAVASVVPLVLKDMIESYQGSIVQDPRSDKPKSH